jgi:hypothetical protein
LTDHDLAIWAFGIAVANACAAFAAVVLYLAKEIISPFFHRKKLRHRALDASWGITSKEKYALKYAQQDDREHLVIDLTVPSHTQDLFLHIILKARTNFLRTGAEFSFNGDARKKPVIQYWFHPFVARGRQEKRPDLRHEYYEQSHYSDYHGNYHIMDPCSVPKGDVLTYGFKIDTREPGYYELTLSITADGVSSLSSLNLCVADPPIFERVRCVDEKHGECFAWLKYEQTARPEMT